MKPLSFLIGGSFVAGNLMARAGPTFGLIAFGACAISFVTGAVFVASLLRPV